ncbi:Protein phosphatase 1L [Crenichthys baileyi]|uniref:Protein phosphatase 1L n=1 Tax=Crenichthys baileyi TaxID=28760 RepID=A0AAV9S955_9TELE
MSLALWSYFFHTDEVKTIVKSSRDAVKIVKGKVAEMMQNERFGGLDVLDAEFSKTLEFKSNNVAVYSIQGRRDHMEDRFQVLTDIMNKSHPSIFGVFDGHGGEAAVAFARTHLAEALRLQLLAYERERDREKDTKKRRAEASPIPPSWSSRSEIREMLDKLSANYNEAGTTCLVALLSDKELIVANLKRIKKAGRFISFNGSWRVQGILAMSRSQGDYPLKNLNVIIPDPDIMSFDLNKLQPEFMILVSNGLWDTFSNEEAIRFIRE